MRPRRHSARTPCAAIAAVAALGWFAWLVGCGSGGYPPARGSVSVVMTDSPRDSIARFEVDVTAVRLQRVRGPAVELLPAPVRVDFAALRELGALVARTDVEPGAFAELTLELDFAHATAVLRSRAEPATVVDTAGRPLAGAGPVAVTLAFAGQSTPRVERRRNHALEVDLDLAEAAQVDETSNRVTFVPLVRAAFDPPAPRRVVAHGTVSQADVRGMRFLLSPLASDGTPAAAIPVQVDASTRFQVSGEIYLGRNGMTALAALPASARNAFVAVALDGSDPLPVATIVECGSAVAGNGEDVVDGLVIGRSTGRGSDVALKVLGDSLDAATGVRRFHSVHTVDVQLGVTRVRQRGSDFALSPDVIQVGQRVQAFGRLDGSNLDAQAPGAVVRLLPVDVAGTVRAATASTVTLELRRIGTRLVDEFDFVVAGRRELEPTALTVDTTALGSRRLALDARIVATGFFAPVGVLGDLDFAASTALDLDATRKLLTCSWTGAAAGTALSVSASNITLDVAGAHERTLDDGVDLRVLREAPAPTLLARGPAGAYRLVTEQGTEVRLDYARFTREVRDWLLLRTPQEVRITASGGCDSVQVFSADAITVTLR